MAVTKIWAIKDSLSRVVDYAANPDKTIYSDLQKVIHYADDSNKTINGKEKACFVTGVNCNADTAFEEMYAVQERFNKVNGNVAYHAYQSFKTDEVTPEQCHRIGVQLAKDMWGTDYQVLVATHFNTGTYHNHFVINSVNMWTGKKFDCNKKAYYKFRDLSDKLCEKEQLTVIKNPSGKTPRSMYYAEKRGEPTKYNLMRTAINYAISISVNQAQFRKALEKQGYIINLDPRLKYATIRSVNNTKNTRLYHLGEQYDRDGIFSRMRENDVRIRSFTNKLISYNLSYQTINDILIVLNLILKFGESEYQITPVKINYLKIEKHEMRVLSKSEQKILTDYLISDNDIYKFGVLLTLYTGIRIGELCALTWNDVNDDYILINKTMYRTKGENNKTEIKVGSPKTISSNRRIPLPQSLLPYIRKYKNNGYVLSTKKQQFCEPRLMQLKFAKMIDKCGIEKANFHALRHPYVKPTTKKFITFFERFPGSRIAAHSCLIRYSWLMPPFPVFLFLKSPALHIQSQSGLPERYRPY